MFTRAKLISILQRMPLKTCLLVIVLCLVLKENYPFSNFPMYSSFSDHTFFIYVSDADDQPIAIEVLTAIRTGRLKKVYDTQLRSIAKKLGKRKRELTVEERHDIGLETLRWFFSSSRDEVKPYLKKYKIIKLYHVDITIDDSEVAEHSPQLVAELDLSTVD